MNSLDENDVFDLADMFFIKHCSFLFLGFCKIIFRETSFLRPRCPPDGPDVLTPPWFVTVTFDPDPKL